MWGKVCLCVRYGSVWQSGGIAPLILNSAVVEGELTGSCRRCSIGGRTPGTQMTVLQSWLTNRTGSGMCSGKISRIIIFIVKLLLWIVLSQTLFSLAFFFNQRRCPPLRLQLSDCSTFRIVCNFPSITVFCSEYVYWLFFWHGFWIFL